MVRDGIQITSIGFYRNLKIGLKNAACSTEGDVSLRCQSYAIPTMYGGIEDIRPYVDEFVRYAEENREQFFYVTRIGCDIAVFKDREISPLFVEARGRANCVSQSRGGK